MVTSYSDVGRHLAKRTAEIQTIRGLVSHLGRVGLVPSGVWRRLPAPRETCTINLPDGQAIEFLTDDNPIGRAVFWTGLRCWEAETTGLFYRLARNAKLILDIGANTGIYTLLACAANRHSQVISFEPVPNTFKTLVANIAINGWEDRCTAYRFAVSDQRGIAAFHVPPGVSPPSASLHVEGFRGTPGDLIDIEVVSLDSLLQTARKVDLVKIDVEGYEDRVLRGMVRILSDSRPRMFVECNPDGPVAELNAILREFGYYIFHLKETGPQSVGGILPDARERFRNFLCTPDNDNGGF